MPLFGRKKWKFKGASMLHFISKCWDLSLEQCPCDIHFVDFLREKKIVNSAIFHFGTGNHHHVGIETAEDGGNNAVLGITASPREYDSYVKLSIEQPTITRSYKAYFGDIYQLDAQLLPTFDVVTLFHLCEFRNEANDVYGALTDLEMASLLIDKLAPGGWLLFYTGSFRFDRAKPVIAELEKIRPIDRIGEYKTLLVYRKQG
jgi:hypothetical protein